MKRADMVRRGAQSLTDLENELDAVLCKASMFTADLIQMRQSANLSPVYGHRAITAAGRSFKLLTEAREAIMELHDHLNEVKTQLGCGAMASGILDKPEDDGKKGITGLHLVG